jgi:cell division septation protein DedD
MSSTAVAGPAQIETALAEATTPSTDVLATRTTALFARSGTMHPLVVGTAFAALLLVSLGIGYGISIIASSGSAEQGVITPADAIRSAAQRPLPIAGPVPGLASQPETVANIRDKKQPPLTTEVATAPKLDDDRKTAVSAGKAGETEASAAPVTDHAYTVQIGSLPNRESAELLWRRVAGAHAGLFADTGMNVRRVRVENRVHYRVQIGAFGNIAGAQEFCQKIQSRGIDCLVTKK